MSSQETEASRGRRVKQGALRFFLCCIACSECHGELVVPDFCLWHLLHSTRRVRHHNGTPWVEDHQSGLRCRGCNVHVPRSLGELCREFFGCESMSFSLHRHWTARYDTSFKSSPSWSISNSYFWSFTSLACTSFSWTTSLSLLSSSCHLKLYSQSASQWKERFFLFNNKIITNNVWQLGI